MFTEYLWESSDDLDALAATLRAMRDGSGRHPVMTLYLNAAVPDFNAVAATEYRSYVREFAYDRHPTVLRSLKRGMDHGIFDVQFHGREHFSDRLWLEALQGDYPGFRGALARHRIPLRGHPGYDRLATQDPRFAYLHRHFIDPTVSPPRALRVEEQAVMIREGLDVLEKHLGVRPVIMAAPGHVWDLNTLEASQREGMLFIDTEAMPIHAVRRERELETLPEAPAWFQRPHGVQTILRNCWFEPYWAENDEHHARAQARVTLQQVRHAFAEGLPAVISTHAMNYTGDRARRDRHLTILADLLREVLREFPEVMFLSAADLARYIYGPKEDICRQGPVEVQKVTVSQRAMLTIASLWPYHHT